MAIIPVNKGAPQASEVAVQTALPTVGTTSREDLQATLAKVDSDIAKLYEDRNTLLTGGGTISYNGGTNTISFTSPMSLELNSLVAGGAPKVVGLTSTSRVFTLDGAMLYAVVDRTAGTATVVADSATLPAITSGKEIFLIAKRRDAGAVKTIYFKDGTVIEQDSSSSLDSTIASGIDVDLALPMVGTAADASLMATLTSVDSNLAKLYEDRNAMLVGGGQITYLGTTVAFTENLFLHLNSLIPGGAPKTIDLGATTRNIATNGDMIYAVVDRTAGTATITDNAATLPSVVAANREVFLIAKRRDDTGGLKRLWFMNGSTFDEGQTAGLGAAGSGSGSGNEILEALKDQLRESNYNLVTPNIFSVDKDDLVDGASTGAYSVVTKTFDFASAAQTMISTDLLDPEEFISQIKNVGKVELTTFWDKANIDDNATYEVSRNGGGNWQALDMERVGNNTEVFTGSKDLQDVETPVTQASQLVAGSSKTLNKTTVAKYSQAFTVTAPTGLSVLDEVSITTQAVIAGRDWTTLNTMASKIQVGLANKAGVWCIGTTDGRIYSSSNNGTSWTDRGTVLQFSGSVYGVASNSTIFWAGGGGGAMSTSTDGITWTQRTSPFSGISTVTDAHYDGTQWVAVADQGPYVATSPTGVTWTARTAPAITPTAVTGSGSRWVAVSYGNAGITSTNGITWSSLTMPFTTDIYDVTYGNGIWIAVGAGGEVGRSTNGTTWALTTSPFPGEFLESVTYADGIFVIGGVTGIATSTDGLTWTKRKTHSVYIVSGIARDSVNNKWMYSVIGSGYAASTQIGVSDALTSIPGSMSASIVKDVAGFPSTNVNDIVATGPYTSIGAFGSKTLSCEAIVTPGNYHVVIETDPIYKAGYDPLFQELKVSIGTAANGASTFNGATWSDDGTNGLAYTLTGWDLDLRFRITSSQSSALAGYGLFYDNDPLTVVGNTLQLEVKQFKAIADNLNTFTMTNFLPNADLLKVYYVQGGQVFHYGAFTLQGHDVIFPANSFNNNAVEADITLVFDQMRGGAYDNSDTNASLLAANFLGSTDATIDKSLAGRGIFLRRPDGTLREIALNNNDEIEVWSI